MVQDALAEQRLAGLLELVAFLVRVGGQQRRQAAALGVVQAPKVVLVLDGVGQRPQGNPVRGTRVAVGPRRVEHPVGGVFGAEEAARSGSHLRIRRPTCLWMAMLCEG